MKAKRIKRNKSNKKKKLQLICIVVFILSILGIGYYFYNLQKDKSNNDTILNDIEIDTSQVTDTKTERMLQIEELQKENSDIIRLDRD